MRPNPAPQVPGFRKVPGRAYDLKRGRTGRHLSEQRGPGAAAMAAWHAGDAMQSGFSLRLENRLVELDRLAAAVEAFGEAEQLSPKLTYQIGLVLDELLTNTIVYGYPEEGGQEITVAMKREGGLLRFEITDAAAPFDPLSARPPDLCSPAGERRIGGLGIHLVRSLMDRVAYERVGNGNSLILEKDLG